MSNKPKVKLGDFVQDTVTGFKGTVTCVSLFLNGCTRCGVQPPIGKDGKIPDSVGFDEPQLKILKAGKVPCENGSLLEDAASPVRKTGGPMIKPMQQQRTPRR